MKARPSVSVVVPTYGRPDSLRTCLDALADQATPADEVIVVCRADDGETRATLGRENPCGARLVTVNRTGTTCAVAAGARAATSEVIAFTDDDAAPRRDWVLRLVEAFATDPRLAALGGPDCLHPANNDVPSPIVGRVGGWGKLVGNHHRPAGPCREVHVLKGVNMAFRRDALSLPAGLRGGQTQPHYEVAMSLAAASEGRRVIFDPELVVDHWPQPRGLGEDRSRPNGRFVGDAAYNLVGCLLAARPELAARRALYGLLVGDRSAPGVARGLLALLRREPVSLAQVLASLAGQASALRDHWSGAGIRLAPLAASEATRRPRVAIVAHDVHDNGGMEHVVAQLVRHVADDMSVHVLSRTLAPELRLLVQWHRVRVPARPFPLKFASFFVLAGVELRRLRPDIVHTVGAIVPNRADIASVHFSHSSFVESGRLAPPGLPPLRRLNRAVARLEALLAERWVYRPGRVGVLAAVSEGLSHDLRRLHPGVRVEVTPNGVDVSRFAASRAQRNVVRDELGVEDDTFVALFVGGDWARKGLGVAVDAVGLCDARHGRVELWVVGSGDVQRYRRQADRAGAVVRFLGQRPDTSRFYSAADVFVLPSLAETFSLAAHEAAASALPVVATAVHGVHELIGDFAAGISVDRDPQAIAVALELLRRDSELRRCMGVEARRRAEALSPDASCEKVVDLYRRISLLQGVT